MDVGQRIRCLLIIRTESPMGLLSRWVAYAGGRLQSQDVYMGLEAINLDIVDGLFGIESTSSIAYSDKELSSPLAVQECGL